MCNVRHCNNSESWSIPLINNLVIKIHAEKIEIITEKYWILMGIVQWCTGNVLGCMVGCYLMD